MSNSSAQFSPSPADEKIDTEGMRRILGSTERPADRSTVWRAVKRGYIPAPRYLTPGRPYWLRREILELVESRAAGVVPESRAA
jgi:hypothetical protein